MRSGCKVAAEPLGRSKDLSVDELDLAIITYLQPDGRATLSEMAQALGVHRNTVKCRLGRLLDKRMLVGGLLIDPVALGYLAPTTIGLRVSPSQVNAVSDRLAALPHIQWVHLCQGTYDITVTGARFRSDGELYSFVTEELGHIPGITFIDTMRSTGIEAPQLDGLLGQPAPAWSASHDTVSGPNQLDDQELALIRELERDVRQTVVALAQALGSDRNTVAERLGRLLRKGIVRPVMIPDSKVLGYPITVVMGTSVLPGQLHDVRDELRRLDSLQYLITCMGRYNIMAWLRFRDCDEWSDMVRTRLAGISGIKEVAASVILKEVKGPFRFATSPGGVNG